MEAVEALEVLIPGPLTTVQDKGRHGYGRFGVPTSGAVDAFSLRIGNRLVGNPQGEAGLEITLYGFKAKALCDLSIAVTGGDLQAHLNNRPLPMWRSLKMRAGDIISFHGPKWGFRAYLAVGGGFSLPLVMESKSTNLTSHFGGFRGRSLQKADILKVSAPGHSLDREFRSFDSGALFSVSETGTWSLRVLPGPQDDHFSQEAKNGFLDSVYKVSSDSDRTGIRLIGPPVRARSSLDASIISEGVVAGTIQVPGDGQPIIILGETVTGGYRKIATVISADLFQLGQVKPGDAVRFIQVAPDDAYQTLKEMEQKAESRLGAAES